MKILRVCVVVVAAALLLLSCYGMTTQTTGKIQFAVSSRTISSAPSGTTPQVRISLFSVKSINGQLVGGSLFTFPSGLSYYPANVGTTVTLPNIPVGSWAILVSAGGVDASGNFITTDYDFPYQVVSVAPGVNNPVSVTLTASPVTSIRALAGQNVNGLAAASVAASPGSNYSVFASTSTALYGVSPIITSLATPPPGLSINSISPGYTSNGVTVGGAIYLNTTGGIVPYDGSTTYPGFATGDARSILQSGAFADPSAPGYIALFYQRSGGVGGTYTNSSTPSNWVDVDLSSEIAGQPIYNFTLTHNTTTTSYGYFASKLGAFRVDQSVVQDQTTANRILSVAKFFTVPDASTILSLCAAGSGAQPLYIGTTSGAWVATLQENSSTAPIAPNPTRIISGDSILQIASAPASSGIPTYVAFLSPYNLYVLNTSTNKIKTYPFYAGLPGRLTSMAWSSTGPTLYISGASSTAIGSSGGLVTISGSSLP